MGLGQSSAGALLLVLLGTVASHSAYGLAFSEWKLKSGQTILFVHDCGKLPDENEDDCKVWQESVSGPSPEDGYPGDARALDQLLSTREKTGKPYDEVWLFSYGGMLEEGIETARVLRQHHATVRVRKGTSCISSCTVIFMGGYFRYVEEGASYRVHSGSSFSEGTIDKGAPASRLLVQAAKDPDKAFRNFAEEEQVSEREMAFRLQRLFQNTLLIPLGLRVSESEGEAERWAESNLPHWDYLDAQNQQRAADVQRFKAEGSACLQDIAMRMERDAMAQAIQDLRAILPSLGKRAGPALDMVSAMYMTSIKETSDLSHETMLRMGYITDDNVPQL
jgi:hypothetical protein